MSVHRGTGGTRGRRRLLRIAAVLALVALATACRPGPTPWRSTVVARGLGCCESPSWQPRFSADGATLVFTSADATLAPGDANDGNDVFALDVASGEVELVSVDVTGTGAGEVPSYLIDISDDGTKVLFASRSSNLVAGDDNLQDDVFVRDLAAGTTTAVAVNTAGVPAGAVNGEMSADGSVVAFLSNSDDLVPGVDDGGPFGGDAYVRNLVTGVTSLASVTAAGKASNDAEGLHISDDGTRVAFSTMANTYGPTDTNQRDDVYVRDLVAGTTTLASANAAGTNAGNNDSSATAISPDGRWVAFDSGATDLGPVAAPGWHTFVRDLATGTTVVLSGSPAGDDISDQPSFSADSARVAFRASVAEPECCAVKADVYVRDLTTGAVTLLSVDASGAGPADGDSVNPTFDPTGTRVAFVSDATNLGPNPPTGGDQVYVRDLAAGVTLLASGGPDGTGDEASRALKPALGPGLHAAYVRQGSGGTNLHLATLQGADLTATLDATPDPVASGQQATVTLHAANAGPDPAEDVRAGVVVPAGATVVGVTGPGTCSTAPAGDGILAACTVGKLAVDGTLDVEVVVQVDAPAGTALALAGALLSPTVDAVPGGQLTAVTLGVT